MCVHAWVCACVRVIGVSLGRQQGSKDYHLSPSLWPCLSPSTWISFIYEVIRALLSSDRATTPTVPQSIYQHYTVLYSTLRYWLKDLNQTERKVEQRNLDFHRDTFLNIMVLSSKTNMKLHWPSLHMSSKRCRHLDFLPEAEKDMKIQLYIHI